MCCLRFYPKPAYDLEYLTRLKTAPRLTIDEVLHLPTKSTVAHPLNFSSAAIAYFDLKEFKTLAKRLGIMDDEKAGVPRTSYRGIVEFWRDDLKVYLVPKVFQP